MEEIKRGLKKFWNFLRGDSWASLIVVLIIAFIVIRFILFPVLSFVTGTPLPLVIVESCSMYHSTNLSDVLDNDAYEERNIELKQTKMWPFKLGINKGDVIFVVGSKNINVGDVIVFNADQPHPIIHRVVEIDDENITTKGDHNSGIHSFDENIEKEKIMGKAIFRIPLVGWAKLIFFEAGKSPSDRGLCK